jgi:hypothetical protein
MATPPRRWPAELEQEREETLQAAISAAHYLLEAQTKTDSARSKISANPSLAILLLSEADRMTTDALARMERIQRCLAVCKGKAVRGRWPSAATRQRDDSFQAAQQANELLIDAQEKFSRAMEKMQHNPGLTDVLIVDAARAQARALAFAERIARLMTEAAFGRG